LPVADAGRQSVPSILRPSRALNEIRSPSIVRSGLNAAASTAGIELVTWRGRERRGAAPGTGRTQTSCGASWLSPMATSAVPSAVNPTARQSARPRVHD
jgi:hypothetical protein